MPACDRKFFIVSAALMLCVAPMASADLLVDCDQGQTAADNLSRGFYLQDFPATALDAVELYFCSNQAGVRTLELTLRADSYDGTVLGSAQADVDLAADWNQLSMASFDFGGLAMPASSTVTFTVSLVSGANPVRFGVGAAPGSCPVVETAGTLPPLDTLRDEGVRLRLYGTGTVPVLSMSWATLKANHR